jgi:SSS family solute:Na+ symporter
MIPGVIAFHLYGDSLMVMDDAYPRLAADVLPAYLSGFFLAVLLGAVLSSFNSLLNSASTLFTIDLIQPLRPHLSDASLIRVARIAGTVLALFSFFIAPLLQYAPEGLWQLIRKFTGFYNIPIIAIVVMAVVTGRTRHRVPAAGALVAIGFHLLAYGFLTFVWDSGIHFIHLYGILFGIEIAIMGTFAALGEREPVHVRPARVVDMTPWRHARTVSVLLLLAMGGVYLLFSPLGLAG